MNKRKLLFRNLLYYRQGNFAIIAGMAVAVAVIVGALAVGDSVKKSLLDIVKQRLGKTESALISHESMFNASLAEKIAGYANIETAPILLLPGTASDPQGRLRANQVNIIGINKDFAKFALKKQTNASRLNSFPTANNAIINKQLAETLNLQPGDEFILRIAKPGLLPEDIPLLSGNMHILSFRLTVKGIADDNFPGNFSFRSSQLAPANIFLPLEWLAEKTDQTGKANVIIAKSEKSDILQKALGKVWSLNDVGLIFKRKKDGTIELKSDKIFIADSISEKAQKIPGAQGVLTYFVNSIELKNKAGKTITGTPYSFVAGIEGAVGIKKHGEARGLRLSSAQAHALQATGGSYATKEERDEILLNQWLADDLKAKVGDTVELKYFIPGPMRKLVEEKHSFKVKAIIPIEGFAADRSLMPDFPGLSDTEKCSDWDTSIPIKMTLIRDKDEAYWKKYKGTPKAFISLKTAQKIWGNRFGNLTMIRFAPDIVTEQRKNMQTPTHSEKIFKRAVAQQRKKETELRNSLEPSDFDLAFQPVKKEAVKSASNGVDFGGLFIGLSFFLLFSAFMLTVLLFLLGIESRRGEFSILESLGFSICEIRRLFLIEGTLLACIGAIIGAPLGLLYNKVILYFLGSVWQGAIGTTSISAYVKPFTPVIGALAGILIAWISMRIALGKYTKNLLKPDETKTVSIEIPQRIKIYLLISIVLCISAVIIIVITLFFPHPDRNPAIFFSCGGMLLLSDWLAWRFCLEWIKKNNLLAESPTPFRLALKNTTFKPMRSMAAVILLSCGIFMTLAVAINKRTTPNPQDKSSGTGGYSFFIKTSIPVTHDMNTAKGQNSMGLDKQLFEGVSFVNMSLSEGDNASCLNLNKVTRPAILGVDFAKFANPERFTFAGIASKVPNKETWKALNEISCSKKRKKVEGHARRDHIPAVADQEVIQWSLGKSLGSDLEIFDEMGENQSLRLDGALVSSIFQGYVLIPKSHFHAIFPSIGGAKCILVAAPTDKEEKIKSALADALTDNGAEITTCRSRLEEFYRVANTYLMIFLILGGLGILIGTAGFGVIVLRNITERRYELAIMNATGYSKSLIRKIITIEHSILISAGCLSGGIAAFVAVIPALCTSTSKPPYLLLMILFMLILLCGIISVYLAACVATKGSTINALRKE